MPNVRTGQDWSTMIKPCPDCGDPVIEAHGSSDVDTDTTFFELEPAGKGVVLRWKDNDALPTQAHVREFHMVHECDGSE